MSSLTAPMIKARMHAVAVEFDLVQPGVAVRRRVDQLRELRRDPFRQGTGTRKTRYRPRHAGSGNSLLRWRMRLLAIRKLQGEERRQALHRDRPPIRASQKLGFRTFSFFMFNHRACTCEDENVA